MFIVCQGNSKSCLVGSSIKMNYQTEKEFKAILQKAKELGLSCVKIPKPKITKKNMNGPVITFSKKEIKNVYG